MEHEQQTHDMNNHDMICNDYLCNDNNNSTICYESCHEERLNKSDWFYLVSQLEKWGVFAPRSVVKKNPQLAWRIMNICKDASVRVKGAYFTTCFKRELYKIENEQKLAYWRSVARQKLGIA